MMELEQMHGSMMRPLFPFDMHRGMVVAPEYVKRQYDKLNDDFFVDLPVLAHKPTAFPRAESASEQDGHVSTGENKSKDNANSNVDNSITDMDVDDEGDAKMAQTKGLAAAGNDGAAMTGARGHSFSSYSFSNSSVVDDKGRRVTSRRRRYEDSTGRLKAVHEREVDGKKLRTTWRRQSKQDDGQHESVCSSGSPEEFEALWQQTPFGEAQKKTVKGQLQSQPHAETEVTSAATALENVTGDEQSVEVPSTQSADKVSTSDRKD